MNQNLQHTVTQPISYCTPNTTSTNKNVVERINIDCKRTDNVIKYLNDDRISSFDISVYPLDMCMSAYIPTETPNEYHIECSELPIRKSLIVKLLGHDKLKKETNSDRYSDNIERILDEVQYEAGYSVSATDIKMNCSDYHNFKFDITYDIGGMPVTVSKPKIEARWHEPIASYFETIR